MTEPPVGVRVTERLRGELGDEDLTMHLTAELTLDETADAGPARVVGHVDHAPVGRPGAARRRTARGSTGPDARLPRAGAGRRPVGGRSRRPGELADDEGLDAWADATTVAFSASSGESATLRLGPLDAARALASAEPVGAHGGLDRAGALAQLARTGLRRVLTTYGT